jgi:hypothetical protein
LLSSNSGSVRLIDFGLLGAEGGEIFNPRSNTETVICQ